MSRVRPAAAVSPPEAADEVQDEVQSGSSLVSLSSGAVSVVSYGCTLAMTHLLGAAEYSVYAAGQMLLSIVGVAAAALVPLPLAHAVSSVRRGSAERAQAVAFACYVSAGLGLAAGLVTAAVAAAVAPGAVVAAMALSAVALPTVAPAWGWMVGERRYRRFAVAATGEAVVRLGVSVAAVLMGWGAGGALAAFAVGAVSASTLAVRHLRAELSWSPAVLGERWRWEETAGIAVTQLAVAALIGADVVLAALVAAQDPLVAGYQALSTLSKGPVYVAASTAVVAFPLLRDGRTRDSALRGALRSFALLAFPVAALVATLPPQLGAIALPDRYTASLVNLPLLAAAGVGYATISLLGTVLLAIRATGRCRIGLSAAALLLPTSMLLGRHLGAGVAGLAVGAAAGALGAAAILLALAARELPAGTGRRAVRGLAALTVLVGALWMLRPHPVGWTLLAGCVGAGVVWALRRRPTGPARARARRRRTATLERADHRPRRCLSPIPRVQIPLSSIPQYENGEHVSLSVQLRTRRIVAPALRHRVRVAGPAPRDLWQAALDADPEAMPSHTPRWLDWVCALRGCVDASRLYDFGGGRTMVLPMAAQRVLGAPVAEASMPHGFGYGGVVAAGPPDLGLRGRPDPRRPPRAARSPYVSHAPAAPRGRLAAGRFSRGSPHVVPRAVNRPQRRLRNRVGAALPQEHPHEDPAGREDVARHPAVARRRDRAGVRRPQPSVGGQVGAPARPAAVAGTCGRASPRPCRAAPHRTGRAR